MKSDWTVVRAKSFEDLRNYYGGTEYWIIGTAKANTAEEAAEIVRLKYIKKYPQIQEIGETIVVPGKLKELIKIYLKAK
jgi:hypothetical protein